MRKVVGHLIASGSKGTPSSKFHKIVFHMLDTQIKCMSFLFLWLTTGKVEARTSKSCKGFAFYHVSGEAFGVFQRLLVPTNQKLTGNWKFPPMPHVAVCLAWSVSDPIPNEANNIYANLIICSRTRTRHLHEAKGSWPPLIVWNGTPGIPKTVYALFLYLYQCPFSGWTLLRPISALSSHFLSLLSEPKHTFAPWSASLLFCPLFL